MESYPKVAIGIPTSNSHKYIYKNLNNIVNELRKDILNKYELIVCLNGDKEQKRSREEIERFKNENRDVKCILVFTNKKGKNNALNLIMDEVSKEVEIIHFLDDDIQVNIKSILININTLIRYRENYGIPILVGSNLHVRNKKVSEFSSNNKIIALKKYILYNIFSVPFIKEAVTPKFCMGGSMCFFRKDFGEYPNDDTGIADDGYIGNYFAIRGKEFYLKENKMNIIKPRDSVMYFTVPTRYDEWLNQQIRIFVGVYYAYLYYECEIEYFKSIFSWEYSVSEEFRGEENNYAKKTIYLYIFKILQKSVLKKSMVIINNGNKPKWGSITTSKIY